MILHPIHRKIKQKFSTKTQYRTPKTSSNIKYNNLKKEDPSKVAEQRRYRQRLSEPSWSGRGSDDSLEERPIVSGRIGCQKTSTVVDVSKDTSPFVSGRRGRIAICQLIREADRAGYRERRGNFAGRFWGSALGFCSFFIWFGCRIMSFWNGVGSVKVFVCEFSLGIGMVLVYEEFAREIVCFLFTYAMFTCYIYVIKIYLIKIYNWLGWKS